MIGHGKLLETCSAPINKEFLDNRAPSLNKTLLYSSAHNPRIWSLRFYLVFCNAQLVRPHITVFPIFDKAWRGEISVYKRMLNLYSGSF